MKGRYSVRRGSIYAGTMFYKCLNYLKLSSVSSRMESRCAVAVFGRDQIRIGFEKCLDLFQITGFGRVVNLATEGKAAPSQRDKQHGDTGENRVKAERA